MTKTDVRELALGVLLEVTEQGEFCHIALGNVLEKYQFLEKQERAFLGRVLKYSHAVKAMKGAWSD